MTLFSKSNFIKNSCQFLKLENHKYMFNIFNMPKILTILCFHWHRREKYCDDDDDDKKNENCWFAY